MSLRFELRLAVAALLGLLILLSFGAIALLSDAETTTTAARTSALHTAGSWSMVLLTLVALSVAGVALRRLTARVERPTAQIAEAVSGFRQGDGFRRCHVDNAAPLELRYIAEALNAIMDSCAVIDTQGPRLAAQDRAALLALLEHIGHPVVFVDALGGLTAANELALVLLGGPRAEALRTALGAAIKGQVAAGVDKVTPLANGQLFLCELSHG